MVGIKLKFSFCLLFASLFFSSVGSAANKGLERYLNTMALLFDHFPSDSHTLESRSLSAGMTLQAIPQIESTFEEAVDTNKTPPVLGVPTLSYAMRTYLPFFGEEAVSLGGKAYIAGLYLNSDSLLGVEKLFYMSRIYGLAVDIAATKGNHSWSLPVTAQHSSSETRGELVMEDVNSRAIFESDIATVGFAYAYRQKVDAAFRLVYRDSSALMFPFSEANRIEVSSSQDPSRFQNLYQLSAGFNISSRLRVSASELIVPGVIAAPSFNVRQTYYF